MTDPIVSVLDRLEGQLGGFGPRRAGLVTEVRSGLEDAADAYRAAGLPEPEARRRAVSDFGDPDVVAQHYQAGELGRRSQQTALGLGAGFAVVLGLWTAWGLTQPGPLVDSSSLGFALVAALALASSGIGWCWTRRQLRQSVPPRASALAVALAVLVLCTGTWWLSYAVHPWTSPAEVQQTGWQSRYAVEAVSAAATVAMLGTALRCLAGLAHRRDPRAGPQT